MQHPYISKKSDSRDKLIKLLNGEGWELETEINPFAHHEGVLDGYSSSLHGECSCVELEYSPIPDPACPLHGSEEEQESAESEKEEK